MKDELVYLNIHIINQALFNRFKDRGLETMDYFGDRIVEFLKKYTSEMNVVISRKDMLLATTGYMEKHNELVKKYGEEKAGDWVREFSLYISQRVMGKELGHNIAYVIYFVTYYVERLKALLELIDKAIELKY